MRATSSYGNSHGAPRKKQQRKRGAAGFLLSSAHVVYNETYVEDADDEALLTSLDMRLDWDRVCCVLLPPQTCPLCLDDPAACPLVLPCGHAFCAGCVVELQSRGVGVCLVCKGPFCLLRPARFIGCAPSLLAVGQSEVFALVVRKRDSSVVWPFDEWEKRWKDGLSCNALPLVSDRASRFSPVLVAREADELAEQAALMDAHLVVVSEDAIEREGLPNWLEARAQLQKRILTAAALPQSARAFVAASRKSGAGIDDFFFFYQAASGEPVYLNALMSKMLLHQAQQDPLRLPQSVNCKLQEVDSFDRDEKTPRVFSHLPAGAHYCCVEGILSELSKETLRTFREELNARSRQRKAKAERVRARDLKFEEETRLRLQKQAREAGQPAQLLLYEEMIHDPVTRVFFFFFFFFAIYSFSALA
jgi:hypothetical protein